MRSRLLYGLLALVAVAAGRDVDPAVLEVGKKLLQEDEQEDTDGSDVEAALLAIDPERAVSYLASFNGAASILADASINRWTEKGGKAEALGVQEVRGLLHKAGVGGDGARAFFVRGEVAATLIKALDADTNGRLSEPELQVGLDLVECAGRALAAEGSAALLDGAAAAALDAALAGVRGCPGVNALWRGWALRVAAAERLLPEAWRASAAECTASVASLLLDALLPGGAEHVGRAGLRAALKEGGVAPFAARHGLATLLLAAADADANEQLDGGELGALVVPLCAGALELRRLGAGAAAGAAHLLLRSEWTFGATAAAEEAAGAGGLHVAQLLAAPLGALSRGHGRGHDAVELALAFVRRGVAAAEGGGSKQEL